MHVYLCVCLPSTYLDYHIPSTCRSKHEDLAIRDPTLYTKSHQTQSHTLQYVATPTHTIVVLFGIGVNPSKKLPLTTIIVFSHTPSASCAKQERSSVNIITELLVDMHEILSHTNIPIHDITKCFYQFEHIQVIQSYEQKQSKLSYS